MAWLETTDEVLGSKSVSVRKYKVKYTGSVGGTILTITKKYKETTTRQTKFWPGLTKDGMNNKIDELTSADDYEDISAEPNPAGGWTVTGTKVSVETEDITSELGF